MLLNRKVSIQSLAILALLSACGGPALELDREGENLQEIINPIKDPEATNKLRAANLAIVKRLSDRFEEGRVYAVKGDSQSQCGHIPHAYHVARNEGALHIGLKVAFVFDDPSASPEFRAAAQSFVSKCESEQRAFWLRNGLHMNLSTRYLEADEESSDEFEHRVKLRNKTCRSHSGSYCLGAEATDLSCGVFIHEIGHLLGLADEYHEKGSCRSAEFSESAQSAPYNFMASSAIESELLDPYPRNVFQVLQNAISPNSNQTSEIKVKFANLKADDLLVSVGLGVYRLQLDIKSQKLLPASEHLYRDNVSDRCSLMLLLDKNKAEENIVVQFARFLSWDPFAQLLSTPEAKAKVSSLSERIPKLECEGEAGDIQRIFNWRDGERFSLTTDLSDRTMPTNWSEVSLYDRVVFENEWKAKFKQAR
jgi:hypothetical protein